MSFTVRADPDSRVRTIRCDGCSHQEQSRFQSVLDEWRRKHTCVRSEPLDRRTEVLP